MAGIPRIFRIRNRKTGLYAKGGMDSSGAWTKKGKLWTGLNYVHTHVYNNAHDRWASRFDSYLESDLMEIIGGEEKLVEKISDYMLNALKQRETEILARYKPEEEFSKYYEEELEKIRNRIKKIEDL